MPIRLIIADDHPIFLDGLDRLLRSEREFQVLACCEDGEQALKAVRKHKPEILIVDLRMPKRDGIALLRELRKEKIGVHVVLLTAEVKEDDLAEAVRLGLRGLLLKDLAPKLIIQCVKRVHAGETWLEKRSVSNTLEKLLRAEAGKIAVQRVLTAREIEVVKQVAIGLHNTQVAKQLFISEGTVKVHLHNIYDKLHLQSRVQLSRYAQQNGLV